MQRLKFSHLSASPPGQTMAEGLASCGYWVRPRYFSNALIKALQREVETLHARGELSQAGIGRGADYQVNTEVRGDVIHWLNRASLAQSLFLDQMESIRAELNRSLFLGLFDFESHFAVYQPGAFYRKHLDSFKGAANRMVSVVAYLNSKWHARDGGELVIYNRDNMPIYRIPPRAGTLAVFLSEDIPHEVLPTYRVRASVAGWFRINNSLWGQLDPPR